MLLDVHGAATCNGRQSVFESIISPLLTSSRAILSRVGYRRGRGIKRTASSAQVVRLVVALAEAGRSLRYTQSLTHIFTENNDLPRPMSRKMLKMSPTKGLEWNGYRKGLSTYSFCRCCVVVVGDGFKGREGLGSSQVSRHWRPVEWVTWGDWMRASPKKFLHVMRISRASL